MFQTKVSVFEKAVILDHPIFLSVGALKLRQGQLHCFRQKSHLLLVLNAEHDGVVHRRVAPTCSCAREGARVLLIEAVRFAESLCKLAQSSNLQTNMDQ